MKSPALIAQGWRLAGAAACCSRWHAVSPGLAIQPSSRKKNLRLLAGAGVVGPRSPPAPKELLWAGDRRGHPAGAKAGHPSAAWGSSPLTTSFTLTLVSFFSFAAFASFSVSRTSCLMNPPGMTDRSREGADGGGPRSSSLICLQEQRLGYGARRKDGSPGEASPAGTLAARAAEHQHPALPVGPATGILQVAGEAAGHPQAPGQFRDAVASRRKSAEKPCREAPRFPHTTKGWVLWAARMRCRLCPTPSSSGMATGGTVPAAASQEAAPGIAAATCRPAGPSVPGPKPKPSPTSRSSHSKRLSQPHPRTAAPAPSPADSREFRPCRELRAPNSGKIAQTRTFRLQRCPEPAGSGTA